MPRARTAAVLAFLLLALSTGAVGGAAATRAKPSEGNPPPAKKQALRPFNRLPLSFERNLGQTHPRVRFLTRTSAYTLFLTDRGPVFSMAGSAPLPPEQGPGRLGASVRMDLIGAHPTPKITGRDRLPGTVSYFKGSDPDRWQSGLATWEEVRYRDAYPGIDMLFHGTREQVEYDFVLAPGADPGRISLRFRGADALRLQRDGDLAVDTPAGQLVHRAPRIYQLVGGDRREIIGGYRLARGRVGFALGAYDRTLPLVIDPLVYSTFLGGSASDFGWGIGVDGTGRAYVTGETQDAAFPTTPGPFDGTHNGGTDVFVASLNAAGSALEFSTFLGGGGTDVGRGITVDGSGKVHVTGLTSSTGFPTTPGAFDDTFNGGTDAFAASLNAAGNALEYSTFLGGGGTDVGRGVTVDGTGKAYVTGFTLGAATNFPTTPGAFDEIHNGGADAFVVRLNLVGTDLEYSTFLGGSGQDAAAGIAVDGTGRAYVTGDTQSTSTNFPTMGAFDDTHNGGADAFVARLNLAGTALEFSTFLGGSGSDAALGIAVDGTDRGYVTGLTSSTGFPTTPGAFDETFNGGNDAFATRLSPTGAALDYSTFLGVGGSDQGHAIDVDGTGRAYVTGLTQDTTPDLPTTVGAFDETHNGGTFDAFVARLSPTGAALEYSTFLGGSAGDQAQGIAADGTGRAYITGLTGSGDFPTTPLVFDTSYNGGFDGFVASVQTPPISLPGGGGDGDPLPPPPPPAPGPPSEGPADTGLTIEKEKVAGTQTFEIAGEVSPPSQRHARAALFCQVGGQTIELWRSRGRASRGALVATDTTSDSGDYGFKVRRPKGRRFFHAEFPGTDRCMPAMSDARRIRGKRFGPDHLRRR